MNRGPFDDLPWPERLKARVITPGPQPRVHGYDVEGDLARHHRFTDHVLMALTGELPDDTQGRLFDIALHFAAPISIAEAPTHAAALARMCEGTASSVVATGVIGLTEQARSTLTKLSSFVAWLSRPEGNPPASSLAEGDADRASVARLRQCIGASPPPALSFDFSREAAILALFHAAGLVRGEQMEAALVFARTPLLAAEAFAMPRGSFREYPVNLPPFDYVEEAGER